jgi:hypothetical protein
LSLIHPSATARGFVLLYAGKLMTWRPRISLLTLLLLMTTLALAISLYQVGQDIVPLRNTVRDLREELGQFNVADFDRVHVQRGETVTGSVWKWRIYLPSDFTLHVGEGKLDEIVPGDFASWKMSKDLQSRSLSMNVGGQFTLEIAVEAHGGKWWLKTATKNEVRGSGHLKGDWYAELSNQIQYSDASYERVSITDATEPVVLLYIRRGEQEQVGDTFVTRPVAGKAETFAIWLEPPPTQAPGAMQYPYGSNNLNRPPLTPRISEQ